MRLKIYKPGQGKYTRLWSGIGAGVIIGIGCWSLYGILEAREWAFLGEQGRMWAASMIPATIFVVLGLLIFWLVNKPVLADFMINAEAELKKVSWSSKREVAISTLIVIIVLFVLSSLLGLSDVVFHWFFEMVI